MCLSLHCTCVVKCISEFVAWLNIVSGIDGSPLGRKSAGVHTFFFCFGDVACCVTLLCGQNGETGFFKQSQCLVGNHFPW
jgi:hypothetical protein